MQRFATHNGRPLRVSNPQEPLEFDSTSNIIPPPCYSPQREAISSVLSFNHSRNKHQHDDDNDSVSMHSCPEHGSHELLPSPHSTEDLRHVNHRGYGQVYTRPTAPSSTATHSYTSGFPQSYSQTLYSTNTVDDHIPADVRHSTMSSSHLPLYPSSAPASRRTTRHSSTPIVASIPHQSIYNSHRPYYPSRALHPATTGHLIYNHPHPGSELRNDPLGSTITFLPEPVDSLSRRNTSPSALGGSHGTAGLSRAVSGRSVANSVAPSTRATNFVSLSRKSTYRRSESTFSFGSRPHPMATSITGTYTIDHRIRIPGGLLKAAHDSIDNAGSRSLDGGTARRKNLVLEVENGGIDVDIHLVPLPTPAVMQYDRPSTSMEGHTPVITQSPEMRIPTNKPYFNARPSGRRSASQAHSRGSTPTLLELRLNNGQSNSRRKKDKFPLIARINAPDPRPPFCLLASTIDTQAPTIHHHIHPQSFRVPSSSHSFSSSLTTSPPPRIRTRRSLSKSPLTLHLPHTFRGPLTVRVAAGNIDAHVNLSKALQEVAVVQWETAVERGYFVGGLVAFGEDFESVEDGWEVVDEVELGQAGADGTGNVSEEWFGDKADVVVGDGPVYLQFVGEDDPFGRPKRFWSRFSR